MRITPFVFAGLVAARAVIPRGADVQGKAIESTPAAASPSPVLVKGGPVTGNGTVPGGAIHPAGATTTDTAAPKGQDPKESPAAASPSPVLVKGGPAIGNGTVPGGGIHPAGGDSTTSIPAPKPQEPTPVPSGPPHYQAPQGSPSQSSNGSPNLPNGAPSQPEISSPHGAPASTNGTVAAPGIVQPKPEAEAPKAGQSCPKDGALVCNGPDYFALCNFGKIDLWLHVAAGTACRDGKIEFA